MYVLIVKHSALGDVVRTPYFARALREKEKCALRLSWITAPKSVPLLRFNPAIDDIWTTFLEARPFDFGRIYSLDDEVHVLHGVVTLSGKAVTCARLDSDHAATYIADSAKWFDMGLLPRFGKARADELKKQNQHGHAEIFSKISNVARVESKFFGNPVSRHGHVH